MVGRSTQNRPAHGAAIGAPKQNAKKKHTHKEQATSLAILSHLRGGPNSFMDVNSCVEFATHDMWGGNTVTYVLSVLLGRS